MNSFEGEEVLLRAPLGAVPAMLEARDRWRRGEVFVADATKSEGGALVDGNWWSASEVAKLRDRLPYEAVRSLLVLCAKSPGQWVEKALADEAAGVSPRQLASELGALSKFSLREFGPGQNGMPKWPIEYRKVANKFSYRMSAEMAALWNS